MGSRRKARELCIKVLFHLSFSDGDADEAFELVCNNFEAPKSSMAYARQMVKGVWEKKGELDSHIGKASKNWRIERMPVLDRSILRLAVMEMLYMDDIPPKVSIDEAVELGKGFGGEDSAAFINGVLDNVFNRLLNEGRFDEGVKGSVE